MIVKELISDTVIKGPVTFIDEECHKREIRFNPGLYNDIYDIPLSDSVLNARITVITTNNTGIVVYYRRTV